MAVEFDAFTATPFGEFVETPMGDRGGKASQLTDIIVNDVGIEGDFTPIILIIANAIAKESEDPDDRPRDPGYQNQENLDVDMAGFESVMEAFNRADWDRLGRVKPNLRIGILQPQYVGPAIARDVGEYHIQYDQGKEMLGPGAFVSPIEGSVRLYYGAEFLTTVTSAVPIPGFVGRTHGPSLPGDGLLALYDRMSNSGQFKMQPWWTQVGLDQFDVFNIGQFRAGFVIAMGGLLGPRVTGFRLPGLFEGPPYSDLPFAYHVSQDLTVLEWLLLFGNFDGVFASHRQVGSVHPRSKIIEMVEIAKRQNGAAIRTSIAAGFLPTPWRWISQLSSTIQSLIPGG